MKEGRKEGRETAAMWNEQMKHQQGKKCQDCSWRKDFIAYQKTHTKDKDKRSVHRAYGRTSSCELEFYSCQDHEEHGMVLVRLASLLDFQSQREGLERDLIKDHKLPDSVNI
jgi:hypothetical protein